MMINQEVQNRLNSKIAWVGVVSAIALFIKKQYGITIDIFVVDFIVELIFFLVPIIIAIFNNPKNKGGF